MDREESIKKYHELKKQGYTIQRAAEEMGLSRGTLYSRINPKKVAAYRAKTKIVVHDAPKLTRKYTKPTKENSSSKIVVIVTDASNLRQTLAGLL